MRVWILGLICPSFSVSNGVTQDKPKRQPDLLAAYLMMVSPPFGLPTQAHPRKMETKAPSPRGFPCCDHTPSLLGAHKDIKRSIPPSGFSEVQISGDAYSFSEFFYGCFYLPGISQDRSINFDSEQAIRQPPQLIRTRERLFELLIEIL